MNFPIPENISFALERLSEKGFEAYLVGGCVRDDILNIRPLDYDITTSASPDETINCFSEFKLILKGLKHGTVCVVINSEMIEITSFRLDGLYLDSRHPKNVSFTRNLMEDLSRRDFTINALAYSPKTGLVDMFSGLKDIESKTIRSVGDAQKRLSEDALRILRALRFASILDFNIDSDTKNAIFELYINLSKISIERIASEISRLILGQSADKIIGEYSDIFLYLMPEIKHLKTALKVFQNVENSPMQKWAALLFFSQGTSFDLLSRLRIKSSTAKAVQTLVDNIQNDLNENNLYRTLSDLGYELFSELIKLKSACFKAGLDTKYSKEHYENLFETAQNLIKNKAPLKAAELDISGLDLIALGFEKGPVLSNILSRLFELVLQGKLNNNKVELVKKAKEFL